MIIAVDVDDVCADLLAEWLRRWNQRHGTKLLPEDITDWEMSVVHKGLPELRQEMYAILHEDDLYARIQPVPGARRAITLLRELGHRVIFVTSCVRDSVDAKVNWLVRWGFLPDTASQPDFYAATDKSLIAADVLVDDRPLNVESFPRIGFLVTRPHNALVKTRAPRVRGLEEVVPWVVAHSDHGGAT